MEYKDFHDLATYANNNWRGGFSHREVANNAYIYKFEFDVYGINSPIIKSLLEQLEEDGTEESMDWIERINRA